MRGSSPGSPSGNPRRSSPVNGVSRGFGSREPFPVLPISIQRPHDPRHRPAPRFADTSPQSGCTCAPPQNRPAQAPIDPHPAAPWRHAGRGPFLYVRTDEFVLSIKRHSGLASSFRQTMYIMKDPFTQPATGTYNHSGKNRYNIYIYLEKSVYFIDCMPYQGTESRGVYDELQAE